MEEIPKTTIALEFGNCFKESILIAKNVCNFFVIQKFNQVYVLVGHLATISYPDKNKLLHFFFARRNWCQHLLISSSRVLVAECLISVEFLFPSGREGRLQRHKLRRTSTFFGYN